MTDKTLFHFDYPPEGRSKWCAGLLRNDSTALAANVRTTFSALEAGGAVLPATVNNEEYDSSFVTSPYTSFIGCAVEKINGVRPALLRVPARGVLLAAGEALKRARINSVVAVNNWLVTTNLYGEIDRSTVEGITSALLGSHPGHLLWWRSLNWKTNGGLMKDLLRVGYTLVPIRQVYIFDPHENPFWERHNSVIDTQVLNKSKFDVVEHEQFSPEDVVRIKRLYDLLYLEKHSPLNPQFTEAFFRTAWEEKWLGFIGLRDRETGELAGYISFFAANGVMTVPAIGYDTARPSRDGVYRQLIALCLIMTRRSGWVLNLSSGTSSFKILRGGRAEIEYSAIYMKHLPASRRLAVRFLQMAERAGVVPLLKLLKL